MSNQSDPTFRQKIIEDAKKILSDYLKGYDVKVYLFGSWARGEEQPSSDIDIAIWDQKKELPGGVISKIRMAFEESTIPYHVDIVNFSTTGTELQQKVLKEGIPWNV